MDARGAKAKRVLTLLPERGAGLRVMLIGLGTLAAAVLLMVAYMLAMPSRRYSGTTRPPQPLQLPIALNLQKEVTYLAGTIGERNLDKYAALQDAARYLLAIMITDTALFRNPHYHRPTDKPETLDYQPMARVVLGIAKLVGYLGK